MGGLTIGWGGELESTEADVVQRLVVDAVRLISILHQLMDWEGRIVGLHHCVWHLGKRERLQNM